MLLEVLTSNFSPFFSDFPITRSSWPIKFCPSVLCVKFLPLEFCLGAKLLKVKYGTYGKLKSSETAKGGLWLRNTYSGGSSGADGVAGICGAGLKKLFCLGVCDDWKK